MALVPARVPVAVAAVLLAAACSAAPTAPVPPLGPGLCSPSTSITGFSDALETATVGGRPVANLSGLAPLPDGRVLALSDRSVLFNLDATATRPLDAVDLPGPGGPLDSEAVVVDTDGTLLVTDETGPQVLRYTADGRRLLGALAVPPELAVAPAGRGQDNATFEGLALQPDGRTLVAALEEPLAADDARITRLVTWDRDPAGAFIPGAQYAVVLELGLAVSEVTATGDGRLLLLERAFDDATGNTVRLVLADPRGAGDVRGATTLTPAALSPTGPTAPVRTTVLADLGACPTLGATARGPQRNPLLDNVEGAAVTRRGADGALELLLVSDDNENPTQTTRTYRLRVSPPAG